MNASLISVSIFFVLSLIGAIVLFKYLKSSATIKKSEYQAGGAIAGFILIYGLLYTSYTSILNSSNAYQRQEWTIIGKVKKDSSRLNDGVTVTFYPPTPNCISTKIGEFRLSDIKFTADEIKNLSLIELQFVAPGYLDMMERVPKEKIQILPDQHEIIIKDTVLMEKE